MRTRWPGRAGSFITTQSLLSMSEVEVYCPTAASDEGRSMADGRSAHLVEEQGSFAISRDSVSVEVPVAQRHTGGYRPPQSGCLVHGDGLGIIQQLGASPQPRGMDIGHGVQGIGIAHPGRRIERSDRRIQITHALLACVRIEERCGREGARSASVTGPLHDRVISRGPHPTDRAAPPRTTPRMLLLLCPWPPPEEPRDLMV